MYPHERSLVNSMQGRPFSLLGVNTDDKVSTAKAAVKENNLNWRSWYDGGSHSIVERFAITGFPTIFLVDHNGIIRFKDLGGESLEVAIEMLVAEAEAAGMKGGPPRPPKADYRVFTAATGARTAGTFQSFQDGLVTLAKKDGSLVKIQLDDLSKNDIAYLKEKGYLVGESTGGTPAVNESVATSPTGDPSHKVDEGPLREVREFVDSTGKFKTQARFIRLEGDKAVLEKTDGKYAKVPLDRLSQSDQAYVRSQENR